jgi:hypothetical protein
LNLTLILKLACRFWYNMRKLLPTLRRFRLKIDIDLVRGGLRRVGYAKSRTSYPLVSGDTYRLMADYVYETGWTAENFARISSNDCENVLFVSLRDFSAFFFQITSLDLHLCSTNLLLHNHDSKPNLSEMQFLNARFSRIFCANWVEPTELASPLPLGLENFSYLRNGVPRDYLRMIKDGLPSFEDRSIEVLGAFSISTNVSERTRAFEFLSNYSKAYLNTEFISPRNYRKLVANSKYVLSPPGSGSDCHRTWEAIYLGAIPIVLRSSWGFPESDLPVLIVSDWDEVPEKILSSDIRNKSSVMELAEKYLHPFSNLRG